jgi:hypothetical protein
MGLFFGLTVRVAIWERSNRMLRIAIFLFLISVSGLSFSYARATQAPEDYAALITSEVRGVMVCDAWRDKDGNYDECQEWRTGNFFTPPPPSNKRLFLKT